MGIFEGKSSKAWEQAVKNSGLSEEKFRPLNGENRFDAYERARKFVEKLKNEKAENILVVSHSGFISDVITILLKLPLEESRHFKTQPGAISYFELDKNFNVKDFSIGGTTHIARI